MNVNRQAGMTLVELVIAIVIIGVAAAALYNAMASITARSADPMLRQQSLMLAEACLDELFGERFSALLGADCTKTRTAASLAQLGEYTIVVTVEPRELAGIDAGNARYVQVEVRDPGGQILTLSGWRACYPEQSYSTAADVCPPRA